MLRRLRRRSIFRKWLSRPPLPPLSKRLRRPSKTWAFFFCSISLSLSQAETAYYLFKRRLKWPDHYSLTFHNLFFFSFLQWVSWTFKKQHQRWRPSFVRPSVVRPSVRSLANISSKMRWRWWYPCLLFAYPRKQAFSSLKESVANKVIRRDTPWAPWKGQDEQDKAATFVCVCVCSPWAGADLCEEWSGFTLTSSSRDSVDNWSLNSHFLFQAFSACLAIPSEYGWSCSDLLRSRVVTLSTRLLLMQKRPTLISDKRTTQSTQS